MSNKQKKSCLEEISIRSLGVIESSNIEFKSGLTVLTGETGAGKTMVLTALTLVLGGKSDSDLIRTGQDRAVVTGKFSIPKSVQNQIIEQGGEIDEDCVVITRTINAQGKSKILIGSALSSTSTVTTIAPELVEIHAQASSSKLLKPAVSRELLDRFGRIELENYQNIYHAYKELVTRIEELKLQLGKQDSQIALLKEFAAEFEKLKPKNGELDQIENEIVKLGAVELLNQAVAGALNIFENDEISAVDQLQQIRKSLESANGKDNKLDDLTDRFNESLFNLQDIFGDLSSYMQSLEADPVRFAFLQERKSALNQLIKKYGKGSDKTIAYEDLILQAESVKERLADLSGGGERVTELEKQRQSLFIQMRDSALELSSLRSQYCEKLSKLVTEEVQKLAMPNGKFLVKQESSSADNPANFTATGLDEIEILFAAHVGSNPLPLSKVASGGELSRVMLALEVVIAEAEPIGTYIFDEVDAGVGGKAAIEIGKRLKKLSNSAQVIVITHLPQVAAWADNHLVVRKNESGLVTQSDVIELSADDRKVEIARMLSGQEDSQSAQEHASELLTMVGQSVIS